jgi:GNAT superfamily N-acetyltransferase
MVTMPKPGLDRHERETPPALVEPVAVEIASGRHVGTKSAPEALEQQIVPFRPEHADGFRNLVTDTLGEFGFTADAEIDPDLADPAGHYLALWIALSRNEVVGSIALRDLGEREVELKRMYLRPSCRGRGVGRRLLATALDWARDYHVRTVRLDTTERMEAARRLYEAHGFVRVAGEAPRQGQRRLLYELRLPQCDDALSLGTGSDE